MSMPPADEYDQLIADADWSEDGQFAEHGPFSLQRDAVGFVTIIEWVDNQEVVRATRKG